MEVFQKHKLLHLCPYKSLEPGMRKLRQICIVMFALLGIAQLQAADFKVGGLYYNKLSEGELNVAGTVEVTSPSGGGAYTSDIVIPEEVVYGGVAYRVVSIGSDAFSGSTKMTKCTIPSSVSQIKYRAFSGTGLVSLSIPSTVSVIEEEAFANNDKLEDVYINAVFVGRHAFYCNHNLSKVTFGPEVRTISEGAFDGDNYIKELHVPSFDIWNGVNIGSSYSGIFGNLIFSDLHYDLMDLYMDGKKITDLVIPNDVLSISPYVFEGCNINSVVFGSDVTNVGMGAFSKCYNLKSVKFNNNLNSIGKKAFYDCNALKEINLPNSLLGIGENSFASCESIETLKIPDNVYTMGEGAFSSCTGLKEVTIGTGLNAIPGYCFISNDNIKEIVIPDNVEEIGRAAFDSCTRLGKLTLGKNLKSMAIAAFEGCTSLQQIISYNTTPPTVHVKQNSWGTDESTFNGVNGEYCNVYVPKESVEDYKSAKGWTRFSHIFSIEDTEDVFMLGGLHYRVLNEAECEVTSGYPVPIGEIVVPASVNHGGRTYTVTGIGDYAFYDNKDITGLTIEEGVRYIGEYALTYDTALKYVSLPSTVERIGDFAFIGCTSLDTLESRNPNPPSIEENYVTFDYETLQNTVLYIPPTENYRDSESEWKSFRNVVFTDFNGGMYFEYIQLSQRAFYKVTGDDTCQLTKALYSDEYFSVGYEPLYYDGKELTVTSVAANAFSYMPYLCFVEFYPSVVSVAANAIGMKCDNLLSVRCNAQTPPSLEGALCENPDIASKIYILVPTGSENSYKSDDNWSAAGVITTKVPSVTKDMFVYAGYPGNRAVVSYNRDYRISSYIIEEYTMPDKVEIEGVSYDVTQILDYAFPTNPKFETFTMPATLKIIGRMAFISSDLFSELRVCAAEPPVFTGNPYFSNYMLENTKLCVPTESESAYRESDYWRDFVNIIPVDGLNGIADISSDSSEITIGNGCVETGNLSVRVYDILGTIVAQGSGLLHLPNPGLYLIQPEKGVPIKIFVPCV